MSLGTITIQIPFRACQWVKWAADAQKMSVAKWLQVATLKQLAVTPGVDLSRSPPSKGEGDDEGHVSHVV